MDKAVCSALLLERLFEGFVVFLGELFESLAGVDIGSQSPSEDSAYKHINKYGGGAGPQSTENPRCRRINSQAVHLAVGPPGLSALLQREAQPVHNQ